MRIREAWYDIGPHEAWIYTTYIDHFWFRVEVFIKKDGVKTLLIPEYVQRGIESTNGVVDAAVEKARILLNVPKDDWL